MVKIIDGVVQTTLKQINDEHGKIMHMLKSTDPQFKKFGEIYFSWIYPNTIKAWHKHNEMIMNYTVPIGMIKLVLYDDRQDSLTYKQINEYYMGVDNYYLLTIPSNIWYGFRAIGNQSAMIANCSTIPHDDKEIIRIPFDAQLIPYCWGIKNE